jgi:hypothetical protein
LFGFYDWRETAFLDHRSRSLSAPVAWLKSALEACQDLGPEGGLERFAASLDPEWIAEALAATGTASIRRRRFPAEQALWLVLGMALLADRSIIQVVDHLRLVLGGTTPLSPSNITKARYKLGVEPLRWLFEKVASQWSDTPGLGGYRGLSLYGADGTHLRVQDSDDNFDHFGKPGGRAGSNDAGYPQLRMVALLNLSNRLLAGMRAGPWSQGEQTLVKELWALVPNDSLTILDRGFTSYMSMLELVGDGENRHFMLRAKSDTIVEDLEDLSDGSVRGLLHAPKHLLRGESDIPTPIEVRVIAYQHPGGKPSRILVSLLDPEAYPAQELIELYHDRWELELSFDELKTHMLERKECLRSKKPEGVYQELWGQMLVYNLVRREMLLAAQQHELPPRRISFRLSLMWIRNFWVGAWMAAPGTLPKKLADFRASLDILILPERRTERRYPRHVKIKMSNYPRNRGRRVVGARARGLADAKPPS